MVDGSDISVLESWEGVKRIPLSEFLARRKKGTDTLVLRAVALDTATARVSTRNWIELFNRDYAGKHYDVDFLWNNSDELGEKYYCSEFAAKFINHFLPTPIPTKPMHFEKYRDSWVRYFKGNPPDGQPGISPGDFERSSLFRHLGFLNSAMVP